MMPYLDEEYGNPGSLHSAGRSAKAAIDRAREQVAEFMGADSPEQIIFTSGGSEANNLAMYWFENMLFRYPPFLITTRIEHDSLLKSASRAIANTINGRLVTLSPNKGGIITTDELEARTQRVRKSSNTAFVSIMSANNELGTLNPVYGLCRYAHDNGWLFHTDAVQAAGLYPLMASKNEYDFMSISSHKIHGPKGVGALYAKAPELISPLICGGSHQEFGKRGGTENVAGIVGFGEACEMMSASYDMRNNNRRMVTDTFLRTLIKTIGGSDKFMVNGDPPLDFKTINLRFDGIDAQTLLLMLDAQGVCVSAGSACTAHEDTPSHVLKAIGLTDEEARSSIRISFSHMNTVAEVEQAAQIIANCVKVLRS